jgi:hypothetical protein
VKGVFTLYGAKVVLPNFDMRGVIGVDIGVGPKKLPLAKLNRMNINQIKSNF